jgi:hypothetical protein
MPEFLSNTVQAHIASKNPENEEYLFLVMKRAEKVAVYPGLWQVMTGTIEKNEPLYRLW